ncbi:trypsin-like serine protease [Streptomyces sp. HUAS TT7]|uniref:trypsin-like serine protease n=1 Tax=Streptomyces sp. HUAS TT7 TaxID=3447507 RepID=UPI003F657B16
MPFTPARTVGAAGLITAALAASLVTAAPAGAVVGEKATDAAYAAMAQLKIGDTQRACSGVLVGAQWVLTAQSCFTDGTGEAKLTAGAPKRKTTVTVGGSDLAQKGGATLAATWLVPRQDRDVVLVKLARRVQGVTPLPLATSAPKTGEQISALGFGRTADSWVPDKLHQATFTLSAVDATSMQLNGSTKATLCQGDAGGPALRTKNGGYEVVSVNSRSWQGGCLGTDPTETRTSASNTRVDDIADWTRQGIGVPGDLTGSGHPDMLAIDDKGQLRLYPGLGNGQLGDMKVIGTGGWSGASIAHRGDFTGNGHEDVVARVGTTLRVYPNQGDGTLGSPITIRTGLPTDAQVVATGDMTGDRIPDLMIRQGDQLYFYAGDPDHRPFVKDPVLLGGGWSPYTLSSLGDVNGDGIPDLLARNTSTQQLLFYPGHADGRLGDRSVFGAGGWGTSWRPLVTGTADAAATGSPSLWATTQDGKLLYYAGGKNADGTPSHGTATVIGGGGWSTIRAIS